MSTLKTNNAQIGQSATATNNFTLYQPASPDGTVRLGVGNSGATTSDALTVTNAGDATVSGLLTSAGATLSSGVLTFADATTMSTAATGNQRIVQGTPQTTNGSTAYGYTGIPSWVKRITLQMNGVSWGSYLSVQVGSGSYTTSGYVGNYSYTQSTGNSSQYNSNIGSGFTITNSGASYPIYGQAILTLANASTNTWLLTSAVAPDAQYGTATAAGKVSLSGVLDRIQLVGAGAFTAGSINIIYEG